jgi:hypothetical protein
VSDVDTVGDAGDRVTVNDADCVMLIVDESESVSTNNGVLLGDALQPA